MNLFMMISLRFRIDIVCDIVLEYNFSLYRIVVIGLLIICFFVSMLFMMQSGQLVKVESKLDIVILMMKQFVLFLIVVNMRKIVVIRMLLINVEIFMKEIIDVSEVDMILE